MELASANDQGVKLIIQRCVGREAPFEKRAELLVAVRRRHELVTLKNAPGVGVNHEDRMLAGVEENGVGRFRADSVDAKELLAEKGSVGSEHPGQRACKRGL
jgi:hypothetical protein